MNTKSIPYYDGEQRLLGELVGNFSASDKKPGIILFPAFEGRGDFALDYAKKLSTEGYVVFVADMYGDAKTSETLEGCIELFMPFANDRALVRKRAELAYDAFLQQNYVDKSQISTIGFCFGGMCALELARSGHHLKTCVTLHGVLAKSDLPTEKMQTKFLILHGYQDPQVPPDALQGFAKEMAAIDLHDWTFTFFGDAKHAFSDPKTGTFDENKEKEMGRVYNKEVAERSFRYTIDFFNEYLTQP